MTFLKSGVTVKLYKKKNLYNNFETNCQIVGTSVIFFLANYSKSSWWRA